MIPQNIQKKHILAAIEEIDKNGVPNGRNATKYLLSYKNKTFPPKYIISLANKFANMTELEPCLFNGGKEVNSFLTSRGFQVIPSHTTEFSPSPTQPVEKKTKNHNERCSECKTTIIEMFRCIYGEVKVNHKIEVPTQLNDYLGKPVHRHLQKLLANLENHRGYKGFIKLRSSLRCDMFVPALNAVIEFDESQHFTQARKIAFSNYPSELKTGFDLNLWKTLCDTINAKDNDPEYRDEQRAWYDTIRDFLPIISGMNPTIRIRMGDFNWCSLNPKNPYDVNIFQNLVSGLDMLKSANAKNTSDCTCIATVNIRSRNEYSNDTRSELLKKVLEQLGGRTDAVVFPAGFYEVIKNASETIHKYGNDVMKILEELRSDTVVCFGIDGRKTKDQIAVAVTQAGIVRVGRKFHPSRGEINIQLAKSHEDCDSGYSRIIENVNGKKAFLAVCYDVFGISQESLKNPGAQMIFNLVHKFIPKGLGSGDVNFARHGFAGASQQWKCPVFGAAVFFDREIPENWPTGVLWNPGERTSTRKFLYSQNTLAEPENKFIVRINDAKEYASIRIYNI